MENNKFYKIMLNTEKNTIFIQLNEEKYEGVLAKVGHIEYSKDNEIEFEMELPQGMEQYYDDSHFTEMIQNAVYDIVATSVQSYWTEAEATVLKTIEEQLVEIFKPYNLNLKGKTYLEALAEKDYMVLKDAEDNNRLFVIKPDSDKKYYFDNTDDLMFIKTEIGGSKLIV